MRLKKVYQSIEMARQKAIFFRALIKDLPVEIVAENPSNSLTCLRVKRYDVFRFFNKMKKKNIFFTPIGTNRLSISHMGEQSFSDIYGFVVELKKWLSLKGGRRKR